MAMSPALFSSLNQFRDDYNQQQPLKARSQAAASTGGLAAAMLPPVRSKGLAAEVPTKPAVQATSLPGVYKAASGSSSVPPYRRAETQSMAALADYRASQPSRPTGNTAEANQLPSANTGSDAVSSPIARSLADAGINRTQFNEIDAATGKVTPMTRYEAEQGYAEFEGNPGDPAKRLGLASGGGGFVGALTNAQAAARLSDYAARGLDYNGNDLSVANQLNAKADQMRQERIARNEQRQAFRQANTIDAQRNHALATLRRENPAAYAKAVLDMPQESAVGGLAAENQRNRIDLERLGLDRAYNEGRLNIEQQNADTALLEATGQGGQPSEYERQLARERAKLDAKRQQAQLDTGRETLPIVDKLSRLEQMTSDSGFWANVGGLAGRPFDSDAATKKQVFDSIASNLVLDAASALKGALSDKDIAFLKETVPKFGNTPEANRQIINNIREYLNRRREQEGLPPLAAQSEAPAGQDDINARAAELKAQGMSEDEILDVLDKEF